MAYSELQADRIRQVLSEKQVITEEKKMMGGLCFMVNGKMCCGLIRQRKNKQDMLMARIGPARYEEALEKSGALPMDFTGRPMNGFIFVEPAGYDLDKDLEDWVNMCLEYNPEAKSSRKS